MHFQFYSAYLWPLCAFYCKPLGLGRSGLSANNAWMGFLLYAKNVSNSSFRTGARAERYLWETLLIDYLLFDDQNKEGREYVFPDGGFGLVYL